jgi:hypothetical protein
LNFPQYTHENGDVSLVASMISQPSPSTIIASCVVSLAFAVIAVVLRLITRVHFVKIFGAEDVFIVLALVRMQTQCSGQCFYWHVTVVELA